MAKADLVLLNGNVRTIDRNVPRAEAVSILNGRVLSVGSNSEVRAETGPETNVIDLGGKTVLPGLNDNHCHPMGYGFALGWIDASSGAVSTLEEILAGFQTATSDAADDKQWIRGRGYDDSRLDVKRHPTRYDLDRVTGHNPAILTRTCGHMAVVNSKALAMAGIDRDTPDPQGGHIVKDESGEPTGLLQELAQNLVQRLIPESTVDDIKTALVRAGEKFLSMGITSVGEAAIRQPKEMQAYQELRREGRLPVRTFTMMLIDETLDQMARLGVKTGFGDEWLRIGPAKMFQDGSGGGRTALMSKPYPDEPENYGIAVYTQEQLDDGFMRAAQAGFQCTAHAIGDHAIDMIMMAFEKALAAHPQEDPRWRIEHCGLLRPDILQRMKKLNIVPVPQPSFIYYLGDSYLANFSEDWISMAYPMRTWIDMGLVPIGSSDAPVTPPDPWYNIRAAVTRLTQDDQEMAPDQRVRMDEALEMFTINGAYGTFEEKIKGTITPGKLADLIVVDRDPHTVEIEEVHTLRTELTISNGKIVFEA